MLQVRDAHLLGDRLDREVRFPQQVVGPLESLVGDVAREGHAEVLLEQAVELRVGKRHALGEGLCVEVALEFVLDQTKRGFHRPGAGGEHGGFRFHHVGQVPKKIPEGHLGPNPVG